MKKIIMTTAMALFLSIGTAHALSLSAAKSQGLVGETPTGYLGVVDNSSSEAKNLVADINAKRKDKYRSISSKNGQPLNIVEKLAAQKVYEKASRGEYLQQGGSWVKK